MAHTPGPWQILPVRGNGLIMIGQDADQQSAYPFYICRVYDVAFELPPNGMDNAKLIVAAPDLLAACEELTSFIKLLGQTRRSSFLARNDLDDYDSTWSDHIEEGFQEPYAKGIAAIVRARGE